MDCYIYRSERKKNTYLFLPAEDDLSQVPESLIKMLGDLTYSFQFELQPHKRLIRSDSSLVIEAIKEHGYFLQLPPGSQINIPINDEDIYYH